MIIYPFVAWVLPTAASACPQAERVKCLAVVEVLRGDGPVVGGLLVEEPVKILTVS